MYWVGKKVISFFFMIFKANLLIQITNINQLCIDHFVRWPFAIFQSASWFRYRRKFASWRQKTESTHFWQPHLNRMFFHSNGFEVNGINDERMMQGQDYTVDEGSLSRPNSNNFLRVTKDVLYVLMEDDAFTSCQFWPLFFHFFLKFH